MKNLKFSVITPTHIRNSYLEDLYDSLVAQTYTNWEWILWLNGGAKKTDVSDKIKNDERVRIYVSTFDNKFVGFNKNKAFHLGSGDVLVEVDHDDILTEDCLEELNKAFQNDEIGFVYSDCAVYRSTTCFFK